MNKIYVAEGKIASNIKGIDVLNNKIIINESINFIIEINGNSNIIIDLLDNISCDLSIISKNTNDISYTYEIGKQSKMVVNKLNCDINSNENITINLNGSNSNFEYVLKTISNHNEKYNMSIYHNAKDTCCNIYNHALNLKENVILNVSSYIPNGITGCTSNQYNRIINLTNNVCLIQPNLYIDEYDVIANHSALIGTFNKDELFYLQSRGISLKDSMNLLIKGFLLSNIGEECIIDMIKEIEVNYE